jgi:hypothetical protein
MISQKMRKTGKGYYVHLAFCGWTKYGMTAHANTVVGKNGAEQGANIHDPS